LPTITGSQPVQAHGETAKSLAINATPWSRLAKPSILIVGEKSVIFGDGA
jgi:hypothetical protein